MGIKDKASSVFTCTRWNNTEARQGVNIGSDNLFLVVLTMSMPKGILEMPGYFILMVLAGKSIVRGGRFGFKCNMPLQRHVAFNSGM